jgi:hypothetical protein
VTITLKIGSHHYFRLEPIKAAIHLQILSFLPSMSQKYIFHILGDSNVSRFLPIVKEAKTDKAVQDATLTRVINAVQLQDALTNPPEEKSTLIIAALTNLLTSAYFES